jgi:hypothetical protein
MNLRREKNRLRQCRRGLVFLFLGGVLAMLQYSCSTSKCALCDIDKSTVYNIEMKDNVRSDIGKKRFVSYFPPVPYEENKKKVVAVIDCDGQEPYKMNDNELKRFILDNKHTIDTSSIEYIVVSSDADIAPKKVSYTSLDSLLLCNRSRHSVKFEVCGMLGSRLVWDNIGANILGIYQPKNDLLDKVIGFGPGGTNLIIGAEAAILPRIALINNKHSFNLGLMTGFWPVDGGMFVPISIHPRLTFNEKSEPIWGKCNAWYLFGDMGTAWDARNINKGNGVPIYQTYTNIEGKTERWFTWFAGLGAGVDLWKSKGRDLSIDGGYRITNLPLSTNEELRKCLQESGKDPNLINASRMADQVFIRIGFTW